MKISRYYHYLLARVIFTGRGLINQRFFRYIDGEGYIKAGVICEESRVSLIEDYRNSR